MAKKKKTGSIEQGTSGQVSSASSPADGRAKQKVDELVEIIRGLVDSQGFFDPREVHERARNTDLAKSASIIMSNLRLQGFGQNDKLRVPITDRPDAIKKLINLASRLRKKGIMVPFDEAVAMILSEAPEVTDLPSGQVQVVPEPKLEPATVDRPARPVPTALKAPAHQGAASVQAQAQAATESELKSLYEESKDKNLKLEAELEAYKQMCFRLIETLRK